MIELRHIKIGYGGKELLRAKTLRAEAGELVALVGPNGSGKSTLLRSILGMQAFLEGNCMLQGKAMHAMTAPARARLISFVSARVGLLPSIRVREVLALGKIPYTGWSGRLSRSQKQEVEDVARLMGLKHYLDQDMDRLSDGERQRVMIARALLQDTPVMLLDEPSAFLDIPHKHELQGLLSRLKDEGRTLVYSTHDLEMALLSADRFWMIGEGRIYEGAPEDLGMQQHLSRLFPRSGLRFDPVRGRFYQPGRPMAKAGLSGGSEESRSWTSMALRRAGYEPRAGSIFPQLHIQERDGKVRWEFQLTKESVKSEFTSLLALVRFLTQEA